MVSDGQKVTLEYFWDEIFTLRFFLFFTNYLNETESTYLNKLFKS